MTNQLKSALTDIFIDAAIGAVVTAVLYFAFLAGGHSSPLGAAFGLGAWVFCLFTLVHCMLTDGGAITDSESIIRMYRHSGRNIVFSSSVFSRVISVKKLNERSYKKYFK
jgi:Ni,Fe-hydrogenase I cytochrome b subunit